MGILALKLLLAPGFVVGSSLVVRRHGALVGGVVGGLPVIAAPILVVLLLVHGRAFAAQASTSALLGLVSLSVFVIVYAALAQRLPWFVALPAGWLGFLGSTAVLSAAGSVGPLPGIVAAYAGFAVALAIVPSSTAADLDMPHPAWDLPVRALVSAAMVLALTEASSSLGAHLSGLLATFPVITSVLAAFTHGQRGAPDALRLLRGMLGGYVIYGLLVLVFALALGAH